jgi:hypothetical protein
MQIDSVADYQSDLIRIAPLGSKVLFVSMLQSAEAITGVRDPASASAMAYHTAKAIAGQLYATTADIEDLLVTASNSLPDSTAFTSTLLPTPTGLVVFDRALRLTNQAHSRATLFSMPAFTWARAQWADTDKPLTLLTGILQTADGSIAVSPLGILQDNEPPEMFDLKPTPALTADVVYELQAFARWLPPFALSFLLFINQTILETTVTVPSRGVRRRCARQHPILQIPMPRVVHLRKRKKTASAESDGDHEAVEWTCRWLVGGHWRNQWYASQRVHQPRWIEPYVKGPEDKPLKPTNRIFAVVR